MSAKDDVREASDRFYAALNEMVNGDASAMADVWSHGAEVTTMHPVGGREFGWDEVQASWEGIAEISSGGEVTLEGQRIRVIGDCAYEVGTEHVTATLAGETAQGDIRVTNIYRCEGGRWTIVHHHTDTDPAMQKIVSRVQGG